MKNDFINPHGVQATKSNNGVLLCYSTDNKNLIELSFTSMSSVLKHFTVKSIDDITGMDILQNAF